MNPPNEPRQSKDATDVALPETPVGEAVRVLERALAQVEAMLGRLEGELHRQASTRGSEEMPSHDLEEELQRALRDVVHRLEDALGNLDNQAQRLSEEASRLSSIADRLEVRLDEVTWAAGQAGAPARPESAREPEPVAPPEPQFHPAGQPVDVVIAAVPGFQGLMDAQRGLSSLAAVEGASVHRYQNGEASLSVALRGSVTAGEIVEGLRQATGQQLVIEEARPEMLRLRLRFVGSLRPEPQAGG